MRNCRQVCVTLSDTRIGFQNGKFRPEFKNGISRLKSAAECQRSRKGAAGSLSGRSREGRRPHPREGLPERQFWRPGQVLGTSGREIANRLPNLTAHDSVLGRVPPAHFLGVLEKAADRAQGEASQNDNSGGLEGPGYICQKNDQSCNKFKRARQRSRKGAAGSLSGRSRGGRRDTTGSRNSVVIRYQKAPTINY